MIITIALMPFVKGLAYKIHAVDMPNQRKVHQCPIPKCGGISMAVGAMVPIIFWGPNTPFSNALLIGTIILVVFGVVDDVKDLKAFWKFTGQIFAALVAVFIGGVKIVTLGKFLPAGMILPDWISILFTIFVIVGITNATNLSDGLDGLAGGISLLIFLCIGYLGYIERDYTSAIFSVAAVGSILGFLRFNSYPAQLFMGDAGSQFLGYLSITLLLRLSQEAVHLSVLLPLIILGIPVLDTLAVMLRRFVKRKSPFIADKNHFHHKLLDLGLYHTEAVLTIYVLQSILIIIAVTLGDANEWVLLSIYSVFSASLLLTIYCLERNQFRLQRNSYFDNNIKSKLRSIRESGIVIKFSFRFIKFGIPLLLLFNCFIPTTSNNNQFLFIISVLLLMSLLLSYNKSWLERVIKLNLYLLTPFLIYMGDQSIGDYLSPNWIKIYNLCYAVIFLFIVITLKFTRRKNGFKSSPLDFLVIIIIGLIAILHKNTIDSSLLGFTAIKVIIIYFSYEVLIGELRIKTSKLVSMTALMLILFSVKALM
jgi:UDP-GlcNAc:undecaprenyl-phosphate GlcNAc-1-phosphate transferase